MSDLIVVAKNSPCVKAIKSPEVFSSVSVFLVFFCFLCVCFVFVFCLLLARAW